MTQFENKLKELLAELDAQKETHEQEEWAKISNTTLAEYRKEQEDVCNEGIAALQNQRDAAIAAKKEQLYNEMRAKSDKQFDYARWKLEETLAQFATENLNE